MSTIICTTEEIEREGEERERERENIKKKESWYIDIQLTSNACKNATAYYCTHDNYSDLIYFDF